MYTKEEIRAAGLDDFRAFLCVVWAYLRLPPPTKVQLDIAYALQHGEKRLIIQAFRGVGKSWITVAFVLWNLLLDPEKKIMVVSASQQLADDFSKFCKQLINGMPILQHLKAREGQRDSSVSFDVGPAKPSKDPSVKSVGITGQLTGSRADLIVGDDLEVPKNSYTHLLRERLAELLKEFDAVLKPKPDARVLLLGTPQIEASVYVRLEGRGYTIRIWPAEIPKNPAVYLGRLAAFVQKRIDAGHAPGTPLDAERFSREDLAARRLSYGEAGYALQFMLDTSPADEEKHPLKLKDAIIFDCDDTMAPVKLAWGREKEGSSTLIRDLQCGGLEGDCLYGPAWLSTERAEYTGTVMAIDPSGQGKDETAYAIVRFAHGLLYLVDVGGYLDGFGETTLQALASKALRHQVNDIIIEKNYGGGMFNELLKPHLVRLGRGRIDEEWKGWSMGQKEMRICDILQPVLNSHRLVIDRRVLEQDLKTQQESPRYSFVHQMTRLSRVKGALANDDRIESVAMAVSYFTERMRRDQDLAFEQHRAELMDAELQRFMQHVVGHRPKVLKFAGRK